MLYSLIQNFLSSKNIIIFSIVSLFATQALYVIFIQGLGHPAPDEIEIIPSIELFLNGDSWWNDKWFLQHFEHRIILTNFIFYLNALLDEGNTVHLMYLGWFFNLVSILPLYILLKKIDKKFIWLIIPISALMFNLSQTTCFTWSLCSISWHLTSLLVILTIFFISKIDEHRRNLVLSLVCSVLVSFTMFQGLLIWFVGFIGLFFIQKNKKSNLLIWFIFAVFTILLFFTNYDFDAIDEMQNKSNNFEIKNIFTNKGLSYILLFLSNGLFVQKSALIFLQYLIGVGIIFSIISSIFYFKKIKFDIKPLIPWFQFGLYAIFGSLILAIGRIEVVSANASRYNSWSMFGQISSIVLILVLLLYFYNNSKGKQKKLVIKILIIFLFVILGSGILIGSYSGFKIGNDLYEKNLLTIDCLRNPIFELKCHSAYYYEEGYNNIKKLRDLKLGIFANQFISINDPLLDNSNWKSMSIQPNGFGKIEYIDSNFNTDRYQTLKPKLNIHLNDNSSVVDIGGWGIFGENNKNVESVYVFVDNKVHSSGYYGYQSPNNTEILGEKLIPSYYAGFGGIILLENLSPGCHTISIRIVNQNEYYEIPSHSQLCIES